MAIFRSLVDVQHDLSVDWVAASRATDRRVSRTATVREYRLKRVMDIALSSVGLLAKVIERNCKIGLSGRPFLRRPLTGSNLERATVSPDGL